MNTTNKTDFSKQSPSSNRILINGIITGALILLMLIPTVFINDLVRERKMRHQEIADEVSNKWSAPQTLNGPYLFIPYKIYTKDKEGKIIEHDRHYWITPDELKVNANM